MFRSNVKSYIIDLSLPEKDRWAEVIENERLVARRVAKTIMTDVPFLKLLAWILKVLYKTTGGQYMGEIESWAQGLGCSTGVAVGLNCSYELSHLACTAGICWVPGRGSVHVRNLDWQLAGLGEATRIFYFQKGRRKFVTVGILGFVGVLSGMLPRKYSVTINWAPPSGRPQFDYGPAFLLRKVLEECDTYDDAVYCLKHTVLSTSVFFTVCGTKRNEACVIERTKRHAVVRKLNGPALIQANHYVTKRFQKNNELMFDAEDEEYCSSYEYSVARSITLEKYLLKAIHAPDLRGIASCLHRKPVCNEITEQQMIFCPRTNEVIAWQRCEK